MVQLKALCSQIFDGDVLLLLNIQTNFIDTTKFCSISLRKGCEIVLKIGSQRDIPRGEVHELRMDGGLSCLLFRKLPLFQLPKLAMIPTFVMNSGGTLPFFDYFVPISAKPTHDLPSFGQSVEKGTLI